MELIDAQVHVVDHDRPERAWVPGRVPMPGTTQVVVPADEMIAAMDRVGVAGAVIVATRHYGLDASYPLEAAAEFPDRFRVVCIADRNHPDVAEYVERWSSEPYAAGMRVIIYNEADRDALMSGGYEALLDAAERLGVPITVFAPAQLDAVAGIARSHPELQLVVDHLGLPVVHPSGADPFENVDAVLGLAALSNVAVKLTAVPSLSTEPFPFPGLWPHIHRYLDAFGPDRLMWGTDWTRVTNATYDEGVDYFAETDQLDAATKQRLGSLTARRIFDWSN